MKFERVPKDELLGQVVNPRSPFWKLTEAIKREAFFQEQIVQQGFTKRDLYMMADTLARPFQDDTIMKAVSDMLDARGVE